jgi:S1-C subfamily serine protease
VTSVAIDAVHGVVLLTLAGAALEPLTLASLDTVLNEPVVTIAVGRAVAAPFPLILDPPLTFEQLEARLASRLDPGAVVVSLDSRLLAFGASAAESARPIAAPRLAEIVSALQRDGRHRHPWTGVEVQTIDGPLRSRFPEGALVVVHVAPSSPAPDQIVPGTVLSEVRAGRERATTDEGVERAIARSRSVTYVRLDGRAFEMEVDDVQSPPGFTADGTIVAPVGLENRLTVAPMSRAAALGFRTGDVVRAIDLRPVRAVSQIEAAMRGTRDRLFTVQRGDEWRFVLWSVAGPERKP